MPNLHSSGPDTLAEMNAQHYDLLPACIVSTTWPTAPGSGLTIGAFSTQGYVRKGSLLSYVDQPARAITLPSAAGTYYLALTTDTHSTPGSFTRVAGSHYAYLQSASAPTYPDGTTPIASAVVSGGNITSVDTAPALTPPLSRQTADAVAITDGRVSLGGHAPTGVLDVQGSVVASDAANNYYSTRVWPAAPSGAIVANGVRVENTTGAGLATAAFYGIYVAPQSASLLSAWGLNLALASGTNRYNVYAGGTAQNYFAGNVGILNSGPTYPLDVTGQARITDFVAFGANMSPFTAARIHMEYPKATRAALSFRPTDNDTGGAAAVLFQNFAAATTVGSISHTATATSFNTSSDVRLKHAVQALSGALEVVRALNPVSFRWQADDSPGVGFLAHELMRHVPEAVTGEPDAIGANGEILPQQVDHGRVLPWAIAGIKELLAQVEALTARVTSLEEQLGL